MKTAKLGAKFGTVMGLVMALSQGQDVHAQNSGGIRPLVGAIRIGKLGYAGSGCPQGSIVAEYSSEQRRIVLRFEEFFAQAGGIKRIDRKNCALAMPVSVPEGYSVRTLAYSLKGFAYLEDQATARIQAENFFAGDEGTILRKTLNSSNDGEFNLRIPRSSGEWSECGEDVTLRTNLSVLVTNSSDESSALVAINEMRGVRSAYIVDLEFRACR